MTSNSGIEALRACPFCGAPAERKTWGSGARLRVGIRCSDRDCGASNRLAFTEDEALALWNTRHHVLSSPALDDASQCAIPSCRHETAEQRAERIAQISKEISDLPGAIERLQQYADSQHLPMQCGDRGPGIYFADVRAVLAALSTPALDAMREALDELEQRATATLAAIDHFNEANGTHLIGPSLLQLGQSIAKARAALSATPVVGRECALSPNGRHQVDTSMESGPNNCFHCEQPMRASLADEERQASFPAEAAPETPRKLPAR